LKRLESEAARIRIVVKAAIHPAAINTLVDQTKHHSNEFK